MKRSLVLWMWLGTNLTACAGPADFGADVLRGQQPIIHGADDRLELYEVTDQHLYALARRNAVALFSQGSIVLGHDVKLVAESLGKSANLCDGERFAEQPAAALCSGTLVGPSTILTAGHCARTLRCEEMSWVRGYYLDSSSSLSAIAPEEVYSCVGIVAEERSPPSALERLDYAFVELDHDAAKVMPIAWRDRTEPLSQGEPMTTIGFGEGIPLKVDSGAAIADVRSDVLDYFTATSDTFHGGSGSGLFDTSYRLVGVQARGGTDYVPSAAGCNARLELLEEPSLTEEAATYAFRALEALCAEAPSNAVCCSRNGSCVRALAAPESSCAVAEQALPARFRSAGWVALLVAIFTMRRGRRSRHCPLRRSPSTAGATPVSVIVAITGGDSLRTASNECGEVLTGQRRLRLYQIGRRALEHHLPALVPRARPQIDDPVGVRHHRQVVLDHDDRFPGVDQPVQKA
jgi:hypothetical protein